MQEQSGKIDFLGAIVLLTFAVWAVIYIGDAIESPAKVEEKKALLEYKKELVSEMVQILIDLESMNDPSVSKFVNEWRAYYTDEAEVTTSSLAELKIIKQRIIADPSSAVQFTAEYKNKVIDDVNAIASPVFGFAPDPDKKPGL